MICREVTLYGCLHVAFKMFMSAAAYENSL